MVGLVFGFLLTASGLGDYHTIHDGLLLRNPYIFLMMGSAMGVAFAGLAVLRLLGRTAYAGRLVLPHHKIERRHIYGGAIFGLGFGVGATCPGMTVAMTTTGGLYALVVLVGLLGGAVATRVGRAATAPTPEYRGGGRRQVQAGVLDRRWLRPLVISVERREAENAEHRTASSAFIHCAHRRHLALAYST
ncbi:MAG: DUF6691 family protein [Blastococcus sp.]